MANTPLKVAEPAGLLVLIEDIQWADEASVALLRHVTDRCDRDGVLAYLESSNPRNIPLYERHGFEILGHAQSGGSPVITPMLRKPQRR